MIGRIQIDTGNAVNGMRQSADQVGESVGLVHAAHGALQTINEQMDITWNMISEITHSAAEQSSAMTLMARSVEHVALLTEENLSGARATESSSHVLKTNVDRMRKAVAQYKV
jgi:methyl-accepting chemotaxis protein